MTTSIKVQINKKIFTLPDMNESDVFQILGFNHTETFNEDGLKNKKYVSLLNNVVAFHGVLCRLANYALKHTNEIHDVDNVFNNVVIKMRKRFEKNCYFPEKEKDVIISFD